MKIGTRGVLAVIGLSAVACKTEAPGKQTPPDAAAASPLSPEEQLVRVSMALRGMRPSPDDMAWVVDDPSSIRMLAEEYAASEAFVATTEDLFAEVLRMRSIDLALPAKVERDDVVLADLGTSQEVRDALSEESLRIVGEVVRQDLPLTEIVTADWTVLDEVGAEIWASHDYDASVGGIQQVSYTDGRPTAGILVAGSFLLRHESNGGNYNPGRASVLSETFLCDSYAERDIPIEGDLSSPEAVAEAVDHNPACVSCHQSVDPLAAAFSPFRQRLPFNQVNQAYAAGCVDLNANQSCYPVLMYGGPEYHNLWEAMELRPPGYFGADADGLQDIGDHIASDPRFSSCMARRFAAYLTQTSLGDVPAEKVAELQYVLVDNDMNARALAVAVVTDPDFLAASVATDEGLRPTELQIVRPEQLDRMVEDLTGLRLLVALGPDAGDVPLLTNDLLGFRAMSGGIDGETVPLPTHLPTPTKLLTMALVAEEAAGHVVDHDLSASSGERTLLMSVDDSTTDEAAVRSELAHLHARILGMPVSDNSVDVDDALVLWQAVADIDGPVLAWKTVVAAMLQSPEVLYY